MKIALLPNLTRRHALSVTIDVCQHLDSLNVDYFFDEITAEQLGDKFAVKSMPRDKLVKNCDAAIAIGGDGSLIHAAKRAVKFRKPILGINAGKLAFMAGVEKNELYLLDDLISGNYTIDTRMMLDVFSINENETRKIGSCLNDVVIARGEQIKLIRLNISCDENHINEYYADGVIISTPTGSTAYSLSAGGPVIDPKIESIMLTPICTHSLFARSLIFEKESVLTVDIPESENDIICISCDGEDAVKLNANDRIIVKKSEYSADFIRLKNESFIDVLNSKLSQRRA